DRDPVVARKLADAIGTKVVRQLNESSLGAIRMRIEELDKRIRMLEDRLGPLAQRAGGPVPDIAAANERERVQAELSDLRSNRSELTTRLTSTGTASVVQPAVLAPPSDPTVMMAAIAGLAGLVLGILVAVVAETVRPTIPGQRRVARRLGVPLLGWADRGPEQLADLGRRIRLAAHKQDVRHVALVGAPGPLPAELASSVAAAVHRGETGAPAAGAGGAAVPGRPAGTRPTDVTRPVPVRRPCCVHAFEDIDPGTDDAVGVVVVVGQVTAVSALEPVHDLVAASGWPLLGVAAVAREKTFKKGSEAGSASGTGSQPKDDDSPTPSAAKPHAAPPAQRVHPPAPQAAPPAAGQGAPPVAPQPAPPAPPPAASPTAPQATPPAAAVENRRAPA
ncbi:MAG TPA: hypothetical protein VIL71_01430, partial [Spirillospora sp.]